MDTVKSIQRQIEQVAAVTLATARIAVGIVQSYSPGGASAPNPWTNSSQDKSVPKRHLDRFSAICRAHPRDQQTDTDTQTTLRQDMRIGIARV